MADDRWKPVRRYEEIYEVSDQGKVRRLALVLKHNLTYAGYDRAALSRNGITQHFAVHRLVLEAFVGPAPEGQQCNHKNGVRHDNRLENLEWCTPSENQLHSYRTLGRQPLRGEAHQNTKLKAKEVRLIRQAVQRKIPQRWLARWFNVHVVTIWDIIHGKTWGHLPI